MIIDMNSPEFGQNIRNLRGKYYLSQRAMAKLLGITVQTLRCWENGTVRPSLTDHMIHRLCQIFDLPDSTAFPNLP